MRRPPPIATFPRYPATAGTCLLAIGLTLAWWGKMPVEQFMVGPGVRRGEVWRLLTSALFHANTIHLLFDVMVTWAFGTYIEERLGHLKTLGLFLLLGFASMAPEYAVLRGGVGLSGIGYGLFGFLWVLHTRDARFADGMDKQTVQTLVGWFFLCIVLTLTKVAPVANLAHGVGCAAGAAMAFAIVAERPRSVAIVAAVVLFTLAAVATDVWWRPWVNLSGDSRDECVLASDALEADRWTEGEKWLNQALRIEPGNAWSWYNLGVVRQRLGQSDSIAAFRKASELDPANEHYRDVYREIVRPPRR